MIRWIGGLIDRAVAVVCAIVFAQAPLFMEQYTHQLIGRESELRLQVETMHQSAAITGKTLEQLIQKFLGSSDADFASQGLLMQSIVDRWQHLSDALYAMQHSPAWEKPFTFLYQLNGDVFKSTLTHFSVGIPLTTEGGLYALAGIAVGYLICASIRKVIRKAYAWGVTNARSSRLSS